MVIEATAPPHSPVVLVGHSLGGITIMALAARHPELFGSRIVAVALLDTSARLAESILHLPKTLLRTGGPLIGRTTVMLPHGELATGTCCVPTRHARSSVTCPFHWPPGHSAGPHSPGRVRIRL